MQQPASHSDHLKDLNFLQDKDTWKLEACVSCVCQGGHVRCSVEKCAENLNCKDGEEPHRDKNECCPKCVPSTAKISIPRNCHN